MVEVKMLCQGPKVDPKDLHNWYCCCYITFLL